MTGSQTYAAAIRSYRGSPVESYVRELHETILDLMAAAGAKGADLDACAMELAQQNREALGAVYDVVRETRAFQALVSATPILEAAQEAIGSKRLHTPFQHAVFRMDMPSEPWRSFGWHQDFPYNALSDRSVTVWIPLTDVGPHNGSIDVNSAASDRLYPVDITWKRSGDGQRLGGRDAFIARRFHDGLDAGATKLELTSGDFVVLGNWVVHRSGRNPGPLVRFSVQTRYGDLFAEGIVQRRWRNRRADGFEIFKELYPELIESEEN